MLKPRPETRSLYTQPFGAVPRTISLHLPPLHLPPPSPPFLLPHLLPALTLSHRIYASTSLRKSTHLPNRQLIDFYE